jgi:hypothetical protein
MAPGRPKHVVVSLNQFIPPLLVVFDCPTPNLNLGVKVRNNRLSTSSLVCIVKCFRSKMTVVGVLSFLIARGRGLLRFSNRCTDCSMFARSFMKIPVEAHYRVRKLCQVRRHFSSEPVGTTKDGSCGADCCDYNPPLARRPTAMSHLKMFEQGCEHGKGWRVAHLSVKKQSDGRVPRTACCRLGSEKLRKSFSHDTTTSFRRRLNRGANLHEILNWGVQLNFAVTFRFFVKIRQE